MAAELIVAPEAEQDLAQAYAWYESWRIGLGEDFLSCVNACIEAIRRTPEMHALVHEHYRRGLVRRFPYAVFYEYVRHGDRLRRLSHRSRSRQMASASSVSWCGWPPNQGMEPTR